MVEKTDADAVLTTFEGATAFTKAVREVYALQMTECFECLEAAIDRSRR
jgi:hypothetical protein